MAYSCCVEKKKEYHTKVKKHLLVTNEARDGTRLPRSAAASVSFFFGGTGYKQELIALGCLLGGLAQPQSPTRAVATATQPANFSGKLLPGRCSCGLGGNAGWKNWVCDGLDFGGGAAGGLR